MESKASRQISQPNCENMGKLCTWNRIRAFLFTWNLPILLVLGLLLGYVYPPPGKFLDELDLGGICISASICVYDSIASLYIAIIFILSGIKLKTDEIKNALKEWKGFSLGVISILFLSPCMSFALVLIPFSISEFALGLALFNSVPAAITSGPMLTAQAKGNLALALLLVVVTNFVGVFTTPLFVTGFVELYDVATSDNVTATEEGQLRLDPLPIMIQLIFIILIPLGIGKLFRTFEFFRHFASRYGPQITVMSSFLLAMVPWMKVSASAEDFSVIDAGSFFGMFGIAIAVHIILLGFNYIMANYLVVINQPEKRAVVIAASQKTLPIALSVLELLPEAIVGSAGLVAIPIICSQLIQIVMDAFIAASWAMKPIEDSKGRVMTQEEHIAESQRIGGNGEHQVENVPRSSSAHDEVTTT